MAGQKKPIVLEYVFQGDTLDLENAIKRVTDLINEATKNFKKFQNGALTPSQKDQIKRAKRLRNELESYVGAEKYIAKDKTGSVLKSINARAKQAINDAVSLHKQSLKMDDKEFDQKQKHQKILTADQAAFYSSLAGQLKGESQAGQLERLANIVQPTIGEEKYSNIMNTVEAFKLAQQQFAAGKITQEELVIATNNLDEAYKRYATTLQRVKVNQKEANKGPEKKAGLFQLLFGKLKSISLYRIARLAVQAVLSQLREGLNSIAEKNTFFNNTMSQLTSTFKYTANQLSSILAPALSIITPILYNVSNALKSVTSELAAMFSVFAGDDNVAIATYQLEDYTESLKKANKGMKGIDELNITETNNEVDNFELVSTESILGIDDTKNLESVRKLFEDIASSVSGILNPVMEVLSSILSLICITLGTFMPILEPIFNILGNAIGGVLTFLIDGILIPIVKWIGYITDNIWLLITAITAVLTLISLFKGAAILKFLKDAIFYIKYAALVVWDFIKAMVASAAQTVKNIALGIKDAVVRWIQAKQYWKLALAIAATAGVAAIAIIGAIGVATAAGEARANSSLGSEPHLARGGIVKHPTLAMVGEGHYNEAVIPLGNSPQFEDMKQDIAERIIMANGTSGGNKTITLNINGKELARTILPDLEYALPQSGLKLRRA